MNPLLTGIPGSGCRSCGRRPRGGSAPPVRRTSLPGSSYAGIAVSLCTISEPRRLPTSRNPLSAAIIAERPGAARPTSSERWYWRNWCWPAYGRCSPVLTASGRSSGNMSCKRGKRNNGRPCAHGSGSWIRQIAGWRNWTSSFKSCSRGMPWGISRTSGSMHSPRAMNRNRLHSRTRSHRWPERYGHSVKRRRVSSGS